MTLKLHSEDEDSKMTLNKKRVLSQILNFLYTKVMEAEWNDTLNSDVNFGNFNQFYILDYFKQMMNQLSDTTSTRHEYVPGSGVNTMISSSRRSPNVRSEVESLKFDLDEEDPTPSSKKNTNINLTTRKNCK